MSAVLRDLRFTFRVFLKQPAYTLMILGILALGIAGNTAIFSIFNGLFLRPFPVENPERLVDLNERAPKWNLEYTGIAPQDFHAWREQNQTFEGMATWQIAGFNLSIDAVRRCRRSKVG